MSASRFTGAAPYYRVFRPGLPAEAVAALTAEADRLGTVRRLLDLGTGTGQVPAALHAAFTEIDAVEADADMLAEADAVLGAVVGSARYCVCTTSAPRTSRARIRAGVSIW